MSDKCITVPLEFMERVDKALMNVLNYDASSLEKEKLEEYIHLSQLLSILVNVFR